MGFFDEIAARNEERANAPKFTGSYLDWRNAQADQSAINPQDYLAASANPEAAYFEKGKSYTADQIGQMTGSPVNNSNTYKGIPYASAANPFAEEGAQGWNASTGFLINPDGTYRLANLGGINPEVQINKPKGNSWTDYMDTAITLASAIGAGYAGAGAVGAAFAPEAAALGSTSAGSIDAYMAGAGLDAGTFGGSAFVPELAGAEAIPFELPDGTMGSIKNGNILDASGNIVAKGGISPTLSAKEALSYANRLKQIGQLLSSTGGNKGASGQQLADSLRSNQPSSYLGQIKMNEHPFLFNPQVIAGKGDYDVSGSNLANALRKP